MDIHTCSAVVLSSSDYKDTDRLLKLFTLEQGVVDVVAKGVKKANAKLKFASALFNFGNYSLVCKNGFYTLTGCEQISDFGFYLADTDRYICANIMAESTLIMCCSQSDPEAFSLFVKCLKSMIYDNLSPYMAAFKYTLYLWQNSGYCKPIKRYDGRAVNDMMSLISYTAETSVENLDEEISVEQIKPCLGRLIRAVEDKFGIALSSAEFL